MHAPLYGGGPRSVIKLLCNIPAMTQRPWLLFLASNSRCIDLGQANLDLGDVDILTIIAALKREKLYT
jgi:hypothetical protein